MTESFVIDFSCYVHCTKHFSCYSVREKLEWNEALMSRFWVKHVHILKSS